MRHTFSQTLQRVRCLPALAALMVFTLALGFGLSAAAQEAPAKRDAANDEACRLLDDPEIRGRMDGLLYVLLHECGRTNELGGVEALESELTPPPPGGVPGGVDVMVNDAVPDIGITSTTQSETSLALNEMTGTLCASFNDSSTPGGLTGFSRSTDGGVTFTDQGSIGAGASGDPALVWQRSTGNFYISTLGSPGLRWYVSTDDCQTFTQSGPVHSGASDDKELAAVDNNPMSPFYGRMYVAWTDFAVGGGTIRSTFTDDNGVTWSAPVNLHPTGQAVQGAWPTVNPVNGDVYVTWIHWTGAGFPNGPVDAPVVRSTDGGATWTTVTRPLIAGVNPQDGTASGNCGRPALKGNIRYLPSPQIAVGNDGVVHIVYTYDGEGVFQSGDASDVFYRRSTDNGATWSVEIKINDDGTASDQYQPSLSVGPTNAVSIGYYDRQLDPNNVNLDYYQRLSFDGGLTFLPSVRLSDVSSPIFINPGLAACYHGDYDTQVQSAAFAHLLWSDDRNVINGHNDADVFMDTVPLADDFILIPTPGSQFVCAPEDVLVTVDTLQLMGFAEPVTMTTSALAAGLSAAFVPNPVMPGASTALTISGTGSVADDTYIVDLTGTSSPGGNIRMSTINFTVVSAVPAAAVLTAPANSAIDVSVAPLFTWDPSPSAVEYTVEVATDMAFTNIVFSGTTASTSLQSTVVLAELTPYYWRVRGNNICGEGGNSDTFMFTTRDVPPILLVDDDDNAPDVRPTWEAALATLGITGVDVFDTGNSDNEPDAAMLAGYDIVLWFSGDEFTTHAGPGPAGDAALASWLDSKNGCLFLSSQDYFFDHGLTSLHTGYLGVTAVTNDVANTSATGANLFGGLGPYALAFPFTNFSDTLTLDGTAQSAFDTNLGIGASSKQDGYTTVYTTVPLVALPLAGQTEVLQRFFDLCPIGVLFADGFESGDLSAWSGSVP